MVFMHDIVFLTDMVFMHEIHQVDLYCLSDTNNTDATWRITAQIEWLLKTKTKDEKKKLPPGANFKKEIPRQRRISRTVSLSYKEPRKEESLKRGHSPTPEKSEGEFTIPASTSKKLMKKQKQRERKEAEKAKEVEKAEKSVGEEVEQLKPGEEKDKEKEKKKLSPSNTKKSSATRASVRHKKF